MDDATLLRYSRHILLDEIGAEGQESLNQTRVLVVGLGGLGSAAAFYLGSAGVHLNLVDGDNVELSNLQRQIIHSVDFLSRNKAYSAEHTLKKINPLVDIQIFKEHLTEKNAPLFLKDCAVIVDCSDNFPTRYLLNRLAFENKKILISGAAIRWEGQVLALDFKNEDSPCYACLFPENLENEREACAQSGVFSPLVGVIGTLQAALTLKMVLGLEAPPFLMRVNFNTMRFQSSRLTKDPRCRVCGK